MNVYIKAQESVCLVHPEIKIKGYHVPVLHRQGFGTENKESKCLSFYRRS